MNAHTSLRALLLIALVCAVIAAPASSDPVSVSYPLVLPAPAAPAVPAAIQGMEVGTALKTQEAQAQHSLPSSLVWQDGTRAFYSTDVNVINAQARVGDREWLATQMGVKCVDFAAHEVRQYTRLDGLPGDRVVAIGATGPDDAAYCVTLSTSASGPVWAICRFDALTNRWAVEQEVPVPNPSAFAHAIPAGQPSASYGNLSGPDEADAFLAGGHGFACFTTQASISPSDPLLWLRRSSSPIWQPTSPDTALRAGIGPLQVMSLSRADDGSIWLGTNRGLWRYDSDHNQWTRFLPDEFILRVALHGNTVWAIAAGQPLPRWGQMPPHLPHLIRLDPSNGTSQDWDLPAGVSPFDSSAMNPTALAVGGDGRVWACEGDSGLSPGSRFCVFDPATAQWSIVHSSDPGGLAAVPDAALPLPLQSFIAPSLEYWRRFPEWFGPNEPEPAVPWHSGWGPTTVMFRPNRGSASPLDRFAPIITQGESQYPSQLRDPGGITWSLAENTNGDFGVIRTKTAVPGRQVYPWAGTPIETNPPINTICAVGGDLLVTTDHEAVMLNLAAGTWANTHLPWEGEGGSQLRYFTQGDHVWLGNGMLVKRYETKTGVATSRFSSPIYRTLMAVTGAGRLWLVADDMNHLPWKRMYRVEPGSQTPIEVPLTLPAALRPLQRSSGAYENGVLKTALLPTTPDPVAVSETPIGDIVWCIGWMTLGGKQVSCLIGLNPKTGQWTTPQPAGWTNSDDLHPITLGDEVYVPAPSGTGSVWMYDTRTGKWACAAGLLKDSLDIGPADELSLISVDKDTIWSLDNEVLRLCRFDKHTQTWNVFPCPVRFSNDLPINKAARVGNAIFVASREGLWRFDIARQTWRRLPEPEYDQKIEYIVGNKTAIWGKTQQGVVRFDKASDKWTTFNRIDNAPERFVSNDMVADEKSVWLYGNSPAYRLNPATGQWSDLTRGALANPSLTLLVQDVVPDGNTVWLLPGGVRASRNEGTEAAEPLLGRYDVVTGRMQWIAAPAVGARMTQTSAVPDPRDKSLMAMLNQPSMMLVEKDVVWVGTQGGVLCCDKASGTVSRFQVPPQYPLPADFVPNTVVRDGGPLWFLGSAGSLRWSP